MSEQHTTEGIQIKLHNRRVTIYRYNDSDDEFLLELKSFDKDVFPRNGLFLNEYGCIVKTDRNQRIVKLKISREALIAICEITKDLLE